MNGFPATSSTPEAPPSKVVLSRPARLLRLLGSLCDPRAWCHLAKLVNFYNYAHVRPLRQMKRGMEVHISPSATFAHAERITLGNRVLVGEDCRLWAGPRAGAITIEQDVLLGPAVLLTAASYRYNEGSPVSTQPMREADITIGADSWLGAQVIVLPGVRIGTGCVVAAGSVVRDCVPDFAIVAGNPARQVGSRKLPVP